MQRSPVLDPKGRPVFAAGGSHSWRTIPYRGYVVSLEWVISETRRRAAPVMVIWSDDARWAVDTGEKGMWAISRRAITEFVEGLETGSEDDAGTPRIRITGRPSLHCFRECQAALPLLGKDPNDRAAFTALVDCVIKFAPDLVHMPPTPMWLQKREEITPMWVVKATNKASGKVLSEAEV